MVGEVKGVSEGTLCLRGLEKWVKEIWKLFGDVKMVDFGADKVVMEFEKPVEAETVLPLGWTMFRRQDMNFIRRNPDLFYADSHQGVKETWIRAALAELYVGN